MLLCPKPLLGLPTLCGRKVDKKYGLGLCKDHSEEELEKGTWKVDRWKSKDYREKRREIARQAALNRKERDVKSLEKVAELRNELNISKKMPPRLPFSIRSGKTRQAALDRWEKVRAYRDSLPFACNLRDAEKMMKEDAEKSSQ